MANTKKNWLDLFTACPFCGSREGLHLTEGDIFYEIQSERGQSCISIQCRKCYLDMYDHTYEERKWEHRVKLLAKKWNNRPFQESE